MRKLFTLLFLYSIFFSCYAKAAESVAEYPYTENFDDTEAGMMGQSENPVAFIPRSRITRTV